MPTTNIICPICCEETKVTVLECRNQNGKIVPACVKRVSKKFEFAHENNDRENETGIEVRCSSCSCPFFVYFEKEIL